MKKAIFLVVSIVCATALALPTMAMHHEKTDGKKDGMTMDKKMDGHDSMEGMTDQMIMLGKATDKGVTAKAHIMDISAKMAEAGKKETHHIMAAFEDESGTTLQPKVIAVKVTAPDKTSSKPSKMMGMDGLYGVNVELTQKGTYTFTIASKLDSGKKLKYTFKFDVK